MGGHERSLEGTELEQALKDDLKRRDAERQNTKPDSPHALEAAREAAPPPKTMRDALVAAEERAEQRQTVVNNAMMTLDGMKELFTKTMRDELVAAEERAEQRRVAQEAADEAKYEERHKAAVRTQHRAAFSSSILGVLMEAHLANSEIEESHDLFRAISAHDEHLVREAVALADKLIAELAK